MWLALVGTGRDTGRALVGTFLTALCVLQCAADEDTKLERPILLQSIKCPKGNEDCPPGSICIEKVCLWSSCLNGGSTPDVKPSGGGGGTCPDGCFEDGGTCVIDPYPGLEPWGSWSSCKDCSSTRSRTRKYKFRRSSQEHRVHVEINQISPCIESKECQGKGKIEKCKYEGETHAIGRFNTSDPCESCECSDRPDWQNPGFGEVLCAMYGCAQLPNHCNPVRKEGVCCPVCTEITQCRKDGKTFKVGETKTEDCVTCKCSDKPAVDDLGFGQVSCLRQPCQPPTPGCKWLPKRDDECCPTEEECHGEPTTSTAKTTTSDCEETEDCPCKYCAICYECYDCNKLLEGEEVGRKEDVDDPATCSELCSQDYKCKQFMWVPKNITKEEQGMYRGDCVFQDKWFTYSHYEGIVSGKRNQRC